VGAVERPRLATRGDLDLQEPLVPVVVPGREEVGGRRGDGAGRDGVPLLLAELVVEASDVRGVVRDLAHRGMMAPVLRRSRFADVISRQLDLFERDEVDLIRQCVEAEQAYDRAERDEAEERYGEYVDLVETGTEALADLRWAYAATLNDEAAEQYEEAFNQTVKKRLPRFGNEIDLR
jgi:hypothetical protein